MLFSLLVNMCGVILVYCMEDTGKRTKVLELLHYGHTHWDNTVKKAVLSLNASANSLNFPSCFLLTPLIYAINTK